MLVNTIVLAALLAVVIQALRPPDDLPESTQTASKNLAEAQVNLLQFYSTSKYPVSAGLSASDVNSYLAGSVEVTSTGGIPALRMEFQRCFVIYREGAFDFVIEQKILGFPFYYSLRMVPLAESGRLSVTEAGAAFGRMPVHPILLPLVRPLFASLLSSLYQVTDLLKLAQGVVVTPDNATLSWPGSPQE